MKNKFEWIEKIKTLESDKIKFAVTDIDGVLRGKIISKAKLLKGIEDGLGFCNVIFGWDVNDVIYQNSAVTGWHTGYPDSKVTVDLSTHRNIPWDDHMPFFLADLSNSSDVVAACPRTLLKTIRQQCLNKGFNPQFAKEFEWYNFKETAQSLLKKNYAQPEPFTTGMFGYSILRLSQHKEYYNDLFNLLSQFNIPLEGLHTETGDGVCEAALDYSDVLEAADRAVLFKSSVKEIASQHQLMASFMAKWSSDFPGSGGHIHQSLWNNNLQNNLFFDERKTSNMSDLMQHYLAGQLFCLPHILPMYAPTVNSYKRYVEGAWASTSVSWGIENRTTALRVINNSPESTRLETRVPGADANPYLSLSAALASGLYGIANKLPLTILQTNSNEYANSANQKFPKTLKDATDAMKSSGIANELFGQPFVDHFVRTREWEWQQFSKKVTDWELQRYFEII